ncbi:translation initiation factor IF-2 [Desulfonatronum sp. SC1]|uniref:translation initiation factor IF-2 n=1 Tax=Desulfonatronum sp. SC1 TaxID=2109626 RepID=UPI000D30B9C7|nr:translation initiation factor IF-2 [Desulfonatronum sp. SC1]PTN34888.1 translation initiation factor IF-2 [Desulfonatronum sp. SC1]
MLGPDRLDHVAARAVVPEQLICYVRAVAGSTPRLFDACLGYESPDDLVLIGYPLHDPPQSLFDEQALSRSVDLALESSRAPRITVLAATRPRQAPAVATKEPPADKSPGQSSGQPRDAYLALPIPAPAPNQKLRNLLRRAGREVTLDQGRVLDQEHLALIDRYLEYRDLEPGTRLVFRNIPAYVQSCPGALVVSAWLNRSDGPPRLAGFVVGDFTSLSTAFYMFAFRDPDLAPPGTADLLLHALLQEGEKRGQVRMNLGLGINPAIRYFKQKWGAEVFLPCVETSWERRPRGWLSRMHKWISGAKSP